MSSVRADVRVSQSIIGGEEEKAVGLVLRRGFLGTGPETQAFEQELAYYLGGEVNVACVSTGTAALHLALQACGIGSGDEVLVPSLTYVASFQAISATGARPVACEVEDSTGLLDLSDAVSRLTDRTRAVMPVHYASAVGDLDARYEFARRYGLRVIEDAAHAFGCTYHKRKVGSFGDVVCFSFDGIKNITSGEGGAVVSRDRAVIQRVQDSRFLGVERDTEKRYQRKRSWEFEVTEQGWRYHMSDVMAAIGRVQLRRLEAEFKPKRVALARRYRESFMGVKGIRLFETDFEAVVPHIQPVRILNGKRDRIRDLLLNHDIEAGLHYKPNHLLKKYGGGVVSFPVCERIYGELLSLPLHPALELGDVDRVVEIVKKAL